MVAILLPSSPEPILLAPGLGAGFETGPTALEKQVFPMPLGKHQGGEGTMEPFLLWDFARSKESHPLGCAQRWGQPRVPRTSARWCLFLNPAGVAGAGSGCSIPPWVEQCWVSRWGGGSRAVGAYTTLPGPWDPRGDARRLPVPFHRSSCSNLLVLTERLGFQGLQIKSGAGLLLLGKGDGLCGKTWPSCCSPNACWGP